MGNSPPPKLELFLSLLKEGDVYLHLDARRPGVIVPVAVAHMACLSLQYGMSMPIDIPDLTVTDFGVSATLSFSRRPQHTLVPWSAVFAITAGDGRGIIYPEDVPEEARSMFFEGPAPAKAPLLRSVPYDGPFEEDTPAPTLTRPALRLVK